MARRNGKGGRSSTAQLPIKTQSEGSPFQSLLGAFDAFACLRAILVVLLCSVAITPLIAIDKNYPDSVNSALNFAIGTYYPYVVPKTLFAHILIDLALIIYVVTAWRYPAARPKSTPIAFAMLIFLAVMSVSGLFGASYVRSMFGTYQRMTGIIDFAHWTAYTIMLGGVFCDSVFQGSRGRPVPARPYCGKDRCGFGCGLRNLGDWFIYFKVAVLVAVLVALIGLYQWVLEPSRVYSTLGNALYLGGYCAVMIFITGRVFYEKRVVNMVVILILLAGVMVSGSRSSVLALIAGILFLAGGYVSAIGKNILHWHYWSNVVATRRHAGILLLLLGGAASVFIALALYKGATPFQQGGWSDRHEAIRIGLRASLDHPFLGYGPENFVVAFARYIDPNRLTVRAMQFDSSHNQLLDVLVETGMTGLCGYLAIVAVIFYSIRRDRWMLAGFAALNVQLLFIFDGLWSNMLLAIFAGWGISHRQSVTRLI